MVMGHFHAAFPCGFCPGWAGPFRQVFGAAHQAAAKKFNPAGADGVEWRRAGPLRFNYSIERGEMNQRKPACPGHMAAVHTACRPFNSPSGRLRNIYSSIRSDVECRGRSCFCFPCADSLHTQKCVWTKHISLPQRLLYISCISASHSGCKPLSCADAAIQRPV